MSLQQRKYKILCFTDNDSGRDVEIILPLRYFAERFLNCTFVHAFVYDVFAVYREKPDLVLLANTIGSPLYFEISRYATLQGVKVFSLISEGNFRTDGSHNYWGYNTDKVFYQEYLCLWSERTRNFLARELPAVKDSIVLTGGTGFDRYKIYSFLSREEYFKIKGMKPYKKVVGYAGWAFGKLNNKQGAEELLFYFKQDKSRLPWLEKQRGLVESILKEAIEKNPDTLFILKKHPNEQNPSIIKEGLNEMLRLESYPNVLYIREEENIHDLISVCDVWLGFETTTAMESWLMGRQTILLNPDPDFERDQLYKGSVIVKDYQQLEIKLKEYYSTGRIAEFYLKDKEEARAKIIKETIGFGDGFNHLRAAYYFQKTLDSITQENLNERKFRFSAKYFIMTLLMHGGSVFYNKKLFSKLYKFKKTIWIFDRFRLPMINMLFELRSPDIEKFYLKHDIEKKFHDKTLFREVLPEEACKLSK
jgi:surface carbohydrate biosynthesis protein